MVSQDTSTLLQGMTLEELSAHIAEAQALLDRKRAEARRAFIEETKLRAEALGIPLKDLLSEAAGKTEASPRKKSTATEKRKVAVKYRDPENQENAWTGRGMMPRWLRAKIDAGAKLEDFLIAP